MKRTVLAALIATPVLFAWASPAHAVITSNVACYAWASQPNTADYSPPSFYRFNRQEKGITIHRNDTGSYTVKCLGINGTTGRGGHVQVTRYGIEPYHCGVLGWGGNPIQITVQCRELSTGNPVDALFDILYLK